MFDVQVNGPNILLDDSLPTEVGIEMDREQNEHTGPLTAQMTTGE